MKKRLFSLLTLSILCLNVFAQSENQMETAPLSSINTEYKDGKQISVYDYNGVLVAITKYKVEEYGKYYKLFITIANHTEGNINFSPDKVSATVKTKKGVDKEIKVMSAEEYLKKVNRKQSWESAMYSYSEASVAAAAGEKVVITDKNAVVSTKTGSYNSNVKATTTNAASTSTSVVIDNDAKIQAQKEANERIQRYKEQLNRQQNELRNSYLKRNTIRPNEDVKGYIYIPFAKGNGLTVSISINGTIYVFPFDQD